MSRRSPPRSGAAASKEAGRVGAETGAITDITARADDPNIRRVRVGRRVVAELHSHEIDSLELAVGAAWTTALAARVAHVQALAEARRQALRRLAQSPIASSRLRELLCRRGHDDSVVEAVIAELTGGGWLDDRAFADAVADSAQRRGALPATTIAARLAARGVDQATAARTAKERGASDEAAACLTFAKKLARSSGRSPSTGRGGPAGKSRRIAATLARQGFDSDTIESTLRRIGLFGEEP